MSMDIKKKKKVVQQQQRQQEQEQTAGSGEYLADHKYDRIRRTLQTNILQGIQTKKLDILGAAKEYEDKGYPITKICDRVTKDIQEKKYETSGSYVRKVLPPKYKDPEQMATAFQQNNAGDPKYRQQQQLKNKDVKDYTEEDTKYIPDLATAKKLLGHLFAKARWFEQDAKQWKEKYQDLINNNSSKSKSEPEPEEHPEEEKEETKVEGVNVNVVYGKDKTQKIQVLQQDLIKYSRQIGILDCEIPEMVFTLQEFNARDKEAEDRLDLDIAHGGDTKGGETRDKHALGICSISRRMIYVKMDRIPGKIRIETKRTKEYIWRKRVPYGLREIRKVMIHELVHYRFMYMSHGHEFETRIKEILRGKEFPRKHIVCPQLSFG